MYDGKIVYSFLFRLSFKFYIEGRGNLGYVRYKSSTRKGNYGLNAQVSIQFSNKAMSLTRRSDKKFSSFLSILNSTGGSVRLRSKHTFRIKIPRVRMNDWN
jgi:hypothetical protein